MSVKTLLDNLYKERDRLNAEYFRLESEYNKANAMNDENSAAYFGHRINLNYSKGLDIARTIMLIYEFAGEES